MRSWLYHKSEAPKVFEGDDIAAAKKKGWCESPEEAAKPIKPKAVKAKVAARGDSE